MPNSNSLRIQSLLPFAWQAGKGANDGWQFVATVSAVIVAALLGNTPLVLVLAVSDPVRQRGLDINNFTPEALGVDPALFLALLLLPFVVGLLTLWYCVQGFHKRDPKTLIQGRFGRIRWNRMSLAFTAWLLLSGASEYFSYWLNPDIYEFTFSGWAFAKTLVVVALMIPLQIALEELLMRGYLLQQITHYSKLPWLGLLVSTVIFAGLHFQNPEVQRFGLLATAPYYLGVGLFLGILTILDDGLELALGIHLATNIFGSVLVNFKGSALPTPSLFQASEINLTLMTVLFVVQAIVFFLLFRRAGNRENSLEMKWSLSSLTSNYPLTDDTSPPI